MLEKDTIKRMVNGKIVEVQRAGYNSMYPEILQAIDDFQKIVGVMTNESGSKP